MRKYNNFFLITLFRWLTFFREKDKRHIESRKTNKQRLDREHLIDPITIVTLHGKSGKYDDIESLDKFPNVHFSIYGAHNEDVYVWTMCYVLIFY